MAGGPPKRLSDESAIGLVGIEACIPCEFTIAKFATNADGPLLDLEPASGGIANFPERRIGVARSLRSTRVALALELVDLLYRRMWNDEENLVGRRKFSRPADVSKFLTLQENVRVQKQNEHADAQRVGSKEQTIVDY